MCEAGLLLAWPLTCVIFQLSADDCFAGPSAENTVNAFISKQGMAVQAESDLQELVAFALSRGIGPQVHSRLASMALAGHKDYGGLVPRMVGESRVARAGHGLHARIQVGDVKALDVDL